MLKRVHKTEGFDFPDGLKKEFWIQACTAYAQHEYDSDPDHFDSTIEFEMSFLLNNRASFERKKRGEPKFASIHQCFTRVSN